jgi:hypothetical protein
VLFLLLDRPAPLNIPKNLLYLLSNQKGAENQYITSALNYVEFPLLKKKL